MKGLFIFLGLLASITGSASDPTETNKAIVRGYMEAIVNQGRWETWDSYFSEKLTFNGSPITKHQLVTMIDQMRFALPDFRLIIEDQIAEGDTVVTRVTLHGTATTGQTVCYMGIGIDRLSEGKVVQMWHLADEGVGNESGARSRP